MNNPINIAIDGIEIGNDVWIGAAYTILKGVKIGKGAVIGANSFVNSKIPQMPLLLLLQ